MPFKMNTDATNYLKSHYNFIFILYAQINQMSTVNVKNLRNNNFIRNIFVSYIRRSLNIYNHIFIIMWSMLQLNNMINNYNA